MWRDFLYEKYFSYFLAFSPQKYIDIIYHDFDKQTRFSKLSFPNSYYTEGFFAPKLRARPIIVAIVVLLFLDAVGYWDWLPN